VLYVDDDTVRTWHRLYEEDGIEGLASFGYEGSACRLSDEQQDKLGRKKRICSTPPCDLECARRLDVTVGAGIQGWDDRAC